MGRTVYLANQRSSLASNTSAYAHSISLDLFTPHYPSNTPTDSTQPSSSSSEEEGGELDPLYYTYPCRCSSQFKIFTKELEQGVEVIGCEGCSERCRVEYEEVIEEEVEEQGEA